jgi:hypothetical protein
MHHCPQALAWWLEPWTGCLAGISVGFLATGRSQAPISKDDIFRCRYCNDLKKIFLKIFLKDISIFVLLNLSILQNQTVGGLLIVL